MKKVILGIALISQFNYTVEGIPEIAKLAKKENQSLVPINFFDNSKARFREQLDNSTQSVVEKFSKLNALPELSEEDRESQKLLAVIDEFCNLNKFCEGEFNLNRNKANEFFHQMLVTRAKDIMRDEIAQKEAEIVRLQGRLDELLKKSPQTAESLRRSDNSIRRAEEDVRRTKHATDNFDVSKYELLRERQINRTFERFSEKLNAIQNEVQESRDNLERTLRDVLEKTQKQYEDSTNILIGNIEDNYDYIIKEVEEKYKDQKRHLAEAYDRQIAVMNDKINEFTALNAGLEREKELLSLINGVYRSNPDNAFIRSRSFISGNAQEIRDIGDLFVRRSRVEDIYNKVRLFSNLLGREDLGVVATSADLDMVRRYVDETRIAPFTAVPPRQRPHLVNVDHGWGNRGGDTEWNNGCRGGGNHDAWVNPVLVGWLNEMGEDNFTKRWWNKYAPAWPGEQLGAAIGRAMSTYNNRLAAYQNQKSQYETQIGRACAIVFPSEEFDRLVKQCNEFIKKTV